MTSVLIFDEALLILINDDWSNSFFDIIMPWIRNKWLWMPLYVFLIAYIGFNFSTRKTYWALFFALMTICLSDVISSKVLKPIVKRERPCQTLELQKDINVRVNCGHGYSFTSSHATNHFALAFYLIFLFGLRKYKRLGLLFWAGIICYAQIYVGVHYPLDCLIGALLGWLIALGTYTLVKLMSTT